MEWSIIFFYWWRMPYIGYIFNGLLFWLKVYNISDFCWYWLSTNLHCSKFTWATSRFGPFSPSFVLSIIFFVLPTYFIVQSVCNSSFYPSFNLNKKMSSECLRVFLYTWYNLAYVTLNTNYLVIQTHRSMLTLLFWVIAFVLFSYIFYV